MVSRTCGSSSTTKIIVLPDSLGRLAESGHLIEPLEAVGIAIIDDHPPARPRSRRSPWLRSNDGRDRARPRGRPIDHHLLEPLARIGSVDPVDPRPDDPTERRSLEIVDAGFEEEADRLPLGGVHIHSHLDPPLSSLAATPAAPRADSRWPAVLRINQTRFPGRTPAPLRPAVRRMRPDALECGGWTAKPLEHRRNTCPAS